MKYKLFYQIATLIVAIIALCSCEKEAEENENQTSISCKMKIDTTNYSKNSVMDISKKWYWNKTDSIFILNADGETGRTYKTIKIMKLDKSVAFEWLYEDLRTNFFQDYTTLPGDNEGTHGYYYTWGTNFENMPSNIFDYLVLNVKDREKAEYGFHIATRDDIWDLAEIVNGSENIPETLKLDYDFCMGKGIHGTAVSNYARFWMISPDPDKYPDCGAFVDWHKNENNKMWLCYPNSKDPQMNVRIVRKIENKQW